MKSAQLILLSLCSLSLALSGCDRSSSTAPEAEPELPAALAMAPLDAPDPALADATEQAWRQADAWLAEAETQAQALHQRLEHLLADPSPDTLDQARSAWRASYRAWYLASPLLNLAHSHPGLFGALTDAHYNLDAYPLEPGYLDYLEGYPYSGIVSDMSLELTATNLRRQHGLTDSTDVSLGWHALAFLLQGEAGARPAEDFRARQELSAEERDMGLSIAELPNNRRRELLLLLSHLLQDDLRALRGHWQEPHSLIAAPYYRLHPHSRLALLRATSHALLAEQLPAVLEAWESRGSDPALGALRLEAALSGLEHFWQHSALPPSADADSAESWLQHLQAAHNSASNLGDDAQRAALAEQLRTLAAPLAPAEPAY